MPQVGHAARFTHSRRRNHDERAAQVVQLLRFGGISNISKALESKRVLPAVQVCICLLVEASPGWARKASVTFTAERAAHGNMGTAEIRRSAINSAEQQNELLSTPDREGRNNQATCRV